MSVCVLMVIIITSADCLTVIVLCAIGSSKESTEAELNTGGSNLFLIGYFWREM